MPVYGTIASRFADAGVTALYHRLIGLFEQKGLGTWPSAIERFGNIRASEPGTAIVPPSRQWYLGEIAESVRGYHKTIRGAGSENRARAPAAAGVPAHAGRNRRRYRGLGARIAEKREKKLRSARAKTPGDLARGQASPMAGDEYVVKIRDTGENRISVAPRVALWQLDPARWRCRNTRTTARS